MSQSKKIFVENKIKNLMKFRRAKKLINKQYQQLSHVFKGSNLLVAALHIPNLSFRPTAASVKVSSLILIVFAMTFSNNNIFSPLCVARHHNL